MANTVAADLETRLKLGAPSELAEVRKEILSKRDPTKLCVTICSGTGCQAYGSEEVYESFVNEIQKNGLQQKVDIRLL